MTTATDVAQITALVAVLREREAAKSRVDPEDNPFAKHTLADLSHGSRKGADDMPAVNMAAKAPNDPAAFALEASRIEVAKEGRADKSAKRMAVAKQRAQRKVEFDRIADSPAQPDPVRLTKAWAVVFHLMLIVTRAARSKQRWAQRLLGSNADDIPQMTLERMAIVLAKQTKFDLDVLMVAAKQLAASEQGIPGNQVVDESEPAEKKQIKQARKWLMGMVNNRVRGAIVDSYMAAHNLRWDNIDLIATVMATMNGPGDDPMLARFKADRAPAFLGTRFQTPGGIDPEVLTVAITAAITDRGLDPMVEFLLDESNRRTDGAVAWQEHAEAIFKLTPGGEGEWMWDSVVKATENHARAKNARGIAAMRHVRNQFEWLPHLIVRVIDSMDPQFRYWNEGRAVLASDFEWEYLPDADGHRYPLQPALKFDTIEEAAQVLLASLAPLVTGKDLVESVVHA